MNILALFRPVRCFVFDVDGVMTDGSLLVMENGELCRRMNIKDGYAIQLAIRNGYRVVVISGAAPSAIIKRLQALGVTDIFTGVKDKKKKLEECVRLYELEWEAVLYMGDDMPDMEAMKTAGLPVCPADAVAEIKAVSRYVSPFAGGSGCVRDVIEKVLKLNDRFPRI